MVISYLGKIATRKLNVKKTVDLNVVAKVMTCGHTKNPFMGRSADRFCTTDVIKHPVMAARAHCTFGAIKVAVKSMICFQWQTLTLCVCACVVTSH